jgi:hypothetical protein
MRVTLSASPAQPIAGEAVVFEIDIENRGQGAVNDVTLDITVPGEVAIERTEAGLGQATQLDSLIRWHLPRLAAGGQATLRLRGTVRPIVPQQLKLCVMLLSSGAPLEHCAAFSTLSGEATPWPDEAEAQSALPTAPVVGAAIMESSTGNLLGLLLLLLGLLGLAAWLGLRYVSARRGEDPAGS